MNGLRGGSRVARQGGFTLIEVLVSLIVLLVGLLGLAGLQVRAQQSELESYQRVQALVLVQDMVHRINTNRKAAGCYAVSGVGGAPFLGVGNAAVFNCVAFGVPETQAVANADLVAWDALLKGQAETQGGTNMGAMVGARGCIVALGGDAYRVSVVWQGMTETAAPTTGNCATGLYGTETRRRIVSTTLRIADLD